MMWKNIQKQGQKWLGVIIITPTVAGLVIAGSHAGIFNLLEWSLRDQFFRLRPAESMDKRIVVVTIDEPDIKHVKKWPMSDRVMARLIGNIKGQQPRGIAIDVYRDLPVEPGHKELVEVFNSTPNLIGIEKASGNPIAPPPALAKLGQVGANDLLLDADGNIRRGLVITGKKDGSQIEGFGVKLALMYLEKEKPKLELSVIDEKKQIFGLGKAKFVPLTGNEGEYSKEDTGGYQILLNYRGGTKSFPTISMTNVLENRIPADLMRDRLVLLGAKAPSLNDNYQTPYSSTLKLAEELTPGVVIHANIASQILSSALQGRPMLQASVKPLNWLMIFFWSGWSAVLGSLYVSRRWISVVGIVLASGVIIILGYIAFLSGWLIPVFTPLLALVSAGVVSVGATLWNNLRQSYDQLEDYAQTLEEKNEALRIAEENYRSIFENALEGIFQASPDGRYISVNPTMANIYGYSSPDEMIASVTEIGTQIWVDPNCLDNLQRRFEEHGSLKDIELQVYRKDGSIIWVEENTRAVLDSNANLLYFEGIVQDITQRKRQEEELKRQLQDLRVEIDQQKRKQDVARITQSDYFKELQEAAENLRLFDDDF